MSDTNVQNILSSGARFSKRPRFWLVGLTKIRQQVLRFSRQRINWFKEKQESVLLTTKHAQCVIYFLGLYFCVADRDFVLNNFIVAY